MGDAWFMVVPPFFNLALDIQWVPPAQAEDIPGGDNTGGQRCGTWAQGSRFDFKRGDSLYDNRIAYEAKWGDALGSLAFCLHIVEASPVDISEAGRYPGSVTYIIFVPNLDRTHLVERTVCQCTQDEFVSLLINGPPSEERSRWMM